GRGLASQRRDCGEEDGVRAVPLGRDYGLVWTVSRRADRKPRVEKGGPREADRKRRTENDGRVLNGARSARPISLFATPFSIRSSRSAVLGPFFSTRGFRSALLACPN